jgi:hypothetical protein
MKETVLTVAAVQDPFWRTKKRGRVWPLASGLRVGKSFRGQSHSRENGVEA